MSLEATYIHVHVYVFCPYARADVHEKTTMVSYICIVHI